MCIRDRAEVDNIEVIKRIVEVGTGISIVPEPAAAPEVRNKSLVAIPISDENFGRQLGVIHKEGRHFSPAAEKFIEMLTRESPSSEAPAAAEDSSS